MSPVNAQQAALNILLEDVAPLLKQAEAIAATLTQVRGELDVKLTTLSQLVQRATEAQSIWLEASRKMAGSATRIETALENVPTGAAALPPARTKHIRLWVACMASALLSGALISGLFWFHARDLVEQARLGKAMQMAWPALDAATRAKLHKLLGTS